MASDRDRIFKSSCCDERDPSALSLKHCIGANRRAMTELKMLELADPLQALQNRFGGTVWLRSQLEDVHLPSVEIDAVGEGSACINCYAQIK